MTNHLTPSTDRLPGSLFRLATIVALLVCLPGFCHAQTPSASVQQLWQKAVLAQQSQQYLRAASFYRKILALQPELTEAEVNLGLMLHLSGNLLDAVNCFEHVSARHPDLYVPNFLAGMDLLTLDHPDRALPFLQQAVHQAPDKIEARIGLANAYLQVKQYSEAREEFVHATRLNAQNAEAWYGLGATYLSMERDQETALRRSPSPFRAVLLAESYMQQGKTEKAVATLSNVVAKAPVVPCAHSLLGFAFLEQSRLDDATQQFGLDWDPASGEGCLLAKLGAVSLEAKRFHTEEALRQLREAYAVDADVVIANEELYAGSLAASGAHVRAILADFPAAPSPTASEDPALSMKQGRYSACSSALALHTLRLDITDLRLLSKCSYYSGHDDRVMMATEQLLNRVPEDAEALYWRIQSTERLGTAAIATASAINPNSPSLHVLTGDMLQEKGDLSDAAGEYRKAIALNSGFLAAHIALARVLNSDHKTDKAEQEIRIVLDASPKDPEANYLMGEILVNRSALADALPFLLNAQRASSDELPFVHADLSMVYEDRGDVTQAIAEMEQAVSLDVDGSYHYRLGHLYLKAGHRAAAEAALQSAEKLRREADAASLFEKQRSM